LARHDVYVGRVSYWTTAAMTSQRTAVRL
jgi:hypothetical protein